MKNFWRTLAGIALLILLWQIAAVSLNKSILVPAPSETLRLMARNFTSLEVLVAAWQTAWKVFAALALAILLGLPLGLLLGLSDGAYHLLRPLIMTVQAVPVISWLSLVIFTWGVNWRGPVFISFLSLFPLAVLTTVAGVHDLDKGLLEMARLYRVPAGKVLREIHLGSLLPFIAAILDVSVGQAWKVALVAEYLCGGDGLGEAILTARMNVEVPAVWALTLGAVLLGLLSEALIKSIARRFQAAWTRS